MLPSLREAAQLTQLACQRHRPFLPSEIGAQLRSWRLAHLRDGYLPLREAAWALAVPVRKLLELISSGVLNAKSAAPNWYEVHSQDVLGVRGRLDTEERPAERRA